MSNQLYFWLILSYTNVVQSRYEKSSTFTGSFFLQVEQIQQCLIDVQLRLLSTDTEVSGIKKS